MRTQASYEDLLKDNCKETGIKSRCIFHDLTDFHILINIIVDNMHDLLEGVCQYDLGLILHQFIYVNNFFTLEQLNNYIRGFDFGDVKNKPTEILETHILRKKLKMSSSEMLCLVRYLPLILGSLIPRENEHWLLLI